MAYDGTKAVGMPIGVLASGTAVHSETTGTRAKRAAMKTKRRRTSKKKGGGKLKFGSPAWRKKYARKAVRSRKRGRKARR
jgi:hypothetical protein